MPTLADKLSGFEFKCQQYRPQKLWPWKYTDKKASVVKQGSTPAFLRFNTNMEKWVL